MKKYVLLFLSIGLSITSCKKNNDDNVLVPNADVTVQNFMWKAMNLWYFWQSDVANLSDTKFPNTPEGNTAYNDFLTTESDPGAFYDNQLLFTEDRFSFYNEDYKELTQSLAGISKSNGLEFGLVRFSGSDDVFGYVQYIIPNSDAATKAIARGDIFTGVDGTTLTVNNYIDLLFGDNDTYTLNMANIANGTITPNSDEVILTKQESLAEDPIFIDKIFEINGEKIGYLMYNQFTNEYDEALNDVFGAFKAGAITSLVLDLRYNPGGSVNTARLLSSMIYGANTQDVFLKARYNLKYQTYLEDNNVELRDFFADKTGAGTTLNSLDLSKVYILTTNGTASASELVINGLAPYLDVVQIGETTRGKNEFSVTMVDDKGNDYIYNPQRIANINPDNIWAIQPLIGRNENAAGFSDYTAGLVPDIVLAEDLENLGILGDQNEPLLARAIQDITGVTGKMDFTVGMPAKPLTSTKMFTPIKDNMFVDKPAGVNFK
ncbi:MAG: S41 family peptidase [Maribacter sp.]|nr:S41 family peptidase [Maribacter sp.]